MILERQRSLLLAIDMQEKLLPAIYNLQEMIQNVKKLIALTKTFNIPFLITEQYPKGLGKTTDELISELADLYKPIEKLTFSCMGEPSFREKIFEYKTKKVDQIIVCGIEAHVCVYQTVIHLLQEGFDVHVVSDAIGSRTQANHAQALELMSSVGAWIKPTETVIFEMLERAGTAEFKAMMPYLK